MKAPLAQAYRYLNLWDLQHVQRTIDISGQQERIPTGEWRKAYNICHASVKATQTEYHTTATKPRLLEERYLA